MQACSEAQVQLAEGKKWGLHKPRQQRDKAREAACEVRSKKQHTNPPDRSVESQSRHWLPPGAVLVARRAPQEPSVPAARSSSPPRAAERSSTVTNPTESYTQKVFKPCPSQADAKTGWGPIENLTVAALDFQHGKLRVPEHNEAFKELAEWIYENSQQQRGEGKQAEEASSLEAVQEGETIPADRGMDYYKRLASQLLTLHNSTDANLIQPNTAPKLDTVAHCARQLWNSIPQADNMPAARQDAEQLTTALKLALSDNEASQPDIHSSCCKEPKWRREKAIWDRMEIELTRQVSVHCHAQGRLLQLALQNRDNREAEMEAEIRSLNVEAAENAAAATEAKARLEAADKEAEKLSRQHEQAQNTVQQLREEVEALKTKRDEMVLKYRRWDVIDSQVKQRELKLQEEMTIWMQRMQEELSAEYKARYLDAVKAAHLAGEDTAEGANSALLPEIV